MQYRYNWFLAPPGVHNTIRQHSSTHMEIGEGTFSSGELLKVGGVSRIVWFGSRSLGRVRMDAPEISRGAICPTP